MYTNIACLNDVINLSCSNGRSISVTKAHWGKYNLACDEGSCCAPHPAYDCTVDMATAEPDLFAYIRNQCDGQQSCDIDFIAYAVNECEADYYADYEQVFYDCFPFDTTQPVGFSAILTKDTSLSYGTVVPFDDVISNFGGHYSTQTYSFTCPVHGVYIFSMSINQYDNNNIRGIIYRNKDELIRSTAADGGYRESASATVITECNAGDQVFVSVEFGGNFDGELSPCHFTGYCLHKK